MFLAVPPQTRANTCLSQLSRCHLEREQALRSSSSGSSGSSPELDAVGTADTTTAVTSLGDATALRSDLNVFSGMEIALDALGASTQWVVAGAVGIALVTRADAGTLVYVVGSLFNAVFSKVLKKTINQVRTRACWLESGRCFDVALGSGVLRRGVATISFAFIALCALILPRHYMCIAR